METYGEDPYLTSRMGVAVVKGLQGNDPKYFKTHPVPSIMPYIVVPNGTDMNTMQKSLPAIYGPLIFRLSKLW